MLAVLCVLPVLRLLPVLLGIAKGALHPGRPGDFLLLGPVVRETDGRVFTLSTLTSMLEIAPFSCVC